MIEQIVDQLKHRGVTRLCHFTPSRNLAHILHSGELIPTSELEAEERQLYNPTDLERLDGFKSHVCCSIEYPNPWYFEKARAKERLFQDWVVILIEAKYLADDATLFCVRNAAAGRGALVRGGADAFDAMFAQRVVGANERVYSRSATRPSACPTDDQAEVLIARHISVKDFLGVAVFSVEQAKLEVVRLQMTGYQEELPPVLIAPAFWDKFALSAAMRSGSVPAETRVVAPAMDLWKKS